MLTKLKAEPTWASPFAIGVAGDVAKLYVDWLLMRRAAHAYRLGLSSLMLSARVAAGDPENITTFS